MSTVIKSAYSTLGSIQLQSQQRMRARKFGLLIGSVVLPLTCLNLLDRLAELPEPLNQTRFPLLARFYIRKALLLHPNDIDAASKDLDDALWAVMWAGCGAASPQATALLVYLAKRYLDDSATSPARLEAALTSLLHKPHVGKEPHTLTSVQLSVGEALADEKLRLEMSLQILRRLVPSSRDPRQLIEHYEASIKRAPPQISRSLTHQLADLKRTDLAPDRLQN